MRFANPPGIANFLAEQADYGSLGNQGLKDETENELAEMGSIGDSMENSMRVVAKDKAADHYRDAKAYAAGAQRQSQMLSSGIGAATGLLTTGMEYGFGGGGGSVGGDYGLGAEKPILDSSVFSSAFT